MSNPKNGQAHRLERMRVFLDNLTDAEPELKAALATVGINAELIAQGETLYDTADTAVMEQDRMEAALADVRGKLNAKRDSRTALYRKHRSRAKEDVTNVLVRELLKLDEQREVHLEELHLAMRHFYTTALERPETHAPLAEFGVTTAVIQAGLTDLVEIERLDSLEVRTNAAKLASTQTQDAALDAMDAWHDARFEEATFATRHKPELMKSLKP